MNSKPITDRLAGRFDMNTDPSTWPGPDDVDAILQQEAWEETEDYLDAALNWGINDAAVIATIVDRFSVTAAYEQAFNQWIDRQTP